MQETSAAQGQAIPILDGIAQLADRYDGFILDLWGVIHDGRSVFPWVPDTLTRLRAAGKRVVLLSNAPRREHVVAERNRELGIDPAWVDGTVTSGEQAWQGLAQRPDAFYRSLGTACLHVGGKRDITMRDGLDAYRFVEEVAEADFILNTGSSIGDGEAPMREAALQVAAKRDLPMICANPDRVVVVGGKKEPCAGAIADRYEELGGRVRWHGKPFPEVYEVALARMGLPKDKVLAVGDSMITDMLGARDAGLDGLFVLGGIHAEDLGGAPAPESLGALAAKHGVAPLAAVPSFQW